VPGKAGGRIPAVEIMMNTAHVAELIKNGEMGQIKDAMEQSMAPGSQTFEQALYVLYSSGQITLENALAFSDSPTNLHWLINNATHVKTGNDAKGDSSDPTTGPYSRPADDLSSIKLNLDMV
jgi:twitching motility protein PilU